MPAPRTATLVARNVSKPRRAELARVDRLEVEPEGLDHVLGVLPDHQAGEVARLDAQRGVDVDHRALDGGRQDRALRGVVRALGLLAQQRGERRQERRQRGGLGRAAGHLVSGAVPRALRGLGVVAVLEDPLLGGRHQLVARRHQLVHQLLLQRVGRLEPGALQQHVHQRALQPQHPGHPGHAPSAGQQAERRLGQADLGLRVVEQDAVLAGERDLEPAAERRAVDRGDDGLGQLLQAAQVGLHALDLGEDAAVRPRGWPGPSATGCRRRRRSSWRWPRRRPSPTVVVGGELVVQAVDSGAHGPLSRPRSWCWRSRSGRRASG